MWLVDGRGSCDQKIRAATSAAETAPLVTELIAQASSIGNGVGAWRDGTIGWQAGEGGLAQNESAHRC
jgi:hypothetical protein